MTPASEKNRVRRIFAVQDCRSERRCHVRILAYADPGPRSRSICSGRVVTTGVPGMATADSSTALPAASDDTVSGDGSDEVLTAAGMESAILPQQGAQQQLIQSHAGDQQSGDGRGRVLFIIRRTSGCAHAVLRAIGCRFGANSAGGVYVSVACVRGRAPCIVCCEGEDRKATAFRWAHRLPYGSIPESGDSGR